MLIQCKNCNTKNNVIEVQELNDIDNFTDRQLIISKCNNCNSDLVILIEIRISDNKPFVDVQSGRSATKIIRREKARIKQKYTNLDTCFRGWVYGRNVESKNKKGEVVIKQYAVGFDSHHSSLQKVVKTN